MQDKPRGFPGFKKSAAAFCRDGIQHNRMPPDWMHAYERRQRDEQWQREKSERDEQEQELRAAYQEVRAAMLKRFVQGEGQAAYEAACEQFKILYRRTRPYTFDAEARQAALMKIEAEQFTFPDFGTWALTRQLDDDDQSE